MLPQVVEYFYQVETDLATGAGIEKFGFVAEQVSVEEIMVRTINIQPILEIPEGNYGK